MQVDLTTLKPFIATRANSCWQTGELYAVGDTIYANSPDHASAGYALCSNAYAEIKQTGEKPLPRGPMPWQDDTTPQPPKPRPEPKSKAR